VKTQLETETEKAFRDCLAGFPAYSPTDEVYVVDIGANPIRDCHSINAFTRASWAGKKDIGVNLCVGYNVNAFRRASLAGKKDGPVAEISIQLEGDRCYVLSIAVRKDQGRRGFGRRLYQAVEAFCAGRGVREMELCPSGMGLLFWPAMGFIEVEPHRMVRRIWHG
jgi:ribosomal protein S18 acetylase RimI-like enzyme